MTRHGVDTRLDHMMQLTKDDHIVTSYDIQVQDAKEAVQPYIVDVTADDLEYLLEEGYISEENSMRIISPPSVTNPKKQKKEPIKVWQVYHEELDYLTCVLPWGNQEAQLWYRQRLAQM